MKVRNSLVAAAMAAVSTLSIQPALAQLAPPTPPPAGLPSVKVVGRGAHYNVIESSWLVTNQVTGKILSRVSHYTELGNGLNYLKDGQWQESNE